jgi:ribosomal protein S18 acetylase RimI-like enzyme
MIARAARADEADYAAFTRFWAQLGPGNAAPTRAHWDAQLCPGTMWLVDDHDQPVAYSLTFAFGARGDVRQIVVDEAARGRGVGKQLMAAVAAKLRAAGCTEWRLEVDEHNAAAIALYTAVGMRMHHKISELRMRREACARFGAMRSGRHVVSPVEPADDAALESNLDLGAGQIARWRRARGHAPLVRVGMTALTQIWFDFTPEHGLLFPFLAPDADTAAHLAAQLPPGPPEWAICAISQPVTSALLATGARLKCRQLEMAGTL